MDFYAKSITQALKHVDSRKSGLSLDEVEKRREANGQNILPSSHQPVTALKIFCNQFKSALIIILIIAGLLSGILGEILDMIVIGITVLFNAVIGFVQENKATRALNKLRNLITFQVMVLRDGAKRFLETTELVPGDIILLEAGDKVPADGRIIELYELTVDESPLTGESAPVKKQVEQLSGKKGVGDRTNMVFQGTVVTNGRAKVVVTATGANTELGHIATLVKDTKDESTPLQQQLQTLSKKIGWIVLCISIAIFAIGWSINVRNGTETIVQIFQTAVAIAVAAIPEGLVISLTVILAIGMGSILKRRALVRRLVAVETLGSVSVICADKTGTLTEGKMQLTRIVTYDLQKTTADIARLRVDQLPADSVNLAVQIGLLANDGAIEKQPDGSLGYIGDTTDTALLAFGVHRGYIQDTIEQSMPRIDEIPFTSERKFIATLHDAPDGRIMYIKGATEVLLDRATHYYAGGKSNKLTKKQRAYFLDQQTQASADGLRVIAVAYRSGIPDMKIDEASIRGLTLVGLLILSDPVRSHVLDTLELAKQAGIRSIMITGDHVGTARAIAAQIGWRVADDEVFDGERLNIISDSELRVAVQKIRIFARVDPVHKIRIVEALQANGEVVAMTGDGVNDAPAIKGADIGIALGSGTDVAKETADMVLLDNSFSTIVAAVEEGRTIYQNIRRVVLYLLSGSFAEVVMITGSMVAGFPIAALPAQILWINLVSETFPNMALAFEKEGGENMTDPPRRKDEPIINRPMKVMIILKSILANIALFAIFVYMWKTTGDIALTRTMVFVGFGIDAFFYIFSIRSLRHMIWQINPLRNGYLLWAVALSWVLLIAAVHWGPLQLLLRTVALSLEQWLLMIAFGLFNVVLIETVKAVYIRKRAGHL